MHAKRRTCDKILRFRCSAIFFYGLWLSITDASLLKFPSGRALVFNGNRI